MINNTLLQARRTPTAALKRVRSIIIPLDKNTRKWGYFERKNIKELRL